MTNLPPSESFESLPMPQRDVPGIGMHRYRVYTDYANYTLVEATSVIDALRASGLPNVHHVLRDSLSLHNVLDITTFEEEALPAPATEEVLIAPPTEPEMKS